MKTPPLCIFSPTYGRDGNMMELIAQKIYVTRQILINQCDLTTIQLYRKKLQEVYLSIIQCS